MLDVGDPHRLDPALLDPAQLLGRIGKLLTNLAATPNASLTIDDALTVGLFTDGAVNNPMLGLRLGLTKPYALGGSDITVSLEQLTSWIHPPTGTVQGGISLGVFRVAADGTVTPAPRLQVGGVGIRIGRSSGPLLDTRRHDRRGRAARLRRHRRHLRRDRRRRHGSSSAAWAPGSPAHRRRQPGRPGACSGSGSEPRARVQPGARRAEPRHRPGQVSLRAGDGDGPWWLAIQRGFGPIYIEQVGFARHRPARTGSSSIALLLDGRVSCSA